MKPSGVRGDARYRTVAEARIVEMLLLHGWAYEIRGGDRASAATEAREALNRWAGMGLPFRRSNGGERCFDPAEVVNFLKWAAIHSGDRFWEDRCIATGRKLVLEPHRVENPPGAPPPPDALGPQRFSVTLRREFNLQGSLPGTRVRLRLPLPLEDEVLRDLEIAFVPPPDVEVDFSIAPGRLDARLPAPLQRTVSIAVEVSFTACPTIPAPHTGGPLDPSETELYTRPGEGLVQVSPRIRAIAAELAGPVEEPWTLVQRFWNYLLDQFTCGVVHYDQLDIGRPTDWVLDTGWFDCQLGSALLVALCRARGIAARMVSGYALYPTSPFHHYWVELWTDDRGWVPLDTVCSDLSARGRDRSWRDYFVGRLDYRMKTQCLPRLFNATPSVRWPPAWYVLPRPDGDGTEIGFYAYDTGALVYRDRIAVRRGTPPPGPSR